MINLHIMKKLAVITLSLVVAALIIYAFILPKKNGDDFNIIFISIDTLRADHLGAYKYPKNTSPNIDQFRKDSVLFRRCMAQSASTLPSHASMFTSLIPSHHTAFFTRKQSLPDSMLTMAEILQRKNFRTISFNDGGQIDPRFGLDQGFELYDSSNYEFQTFKRIVDKSINWLEGNPGEKFFLFLHTYETHHPYTPKPGYLELFESDYNGPLPKDISVELINKVNAGEVELSEADKKHFINTYDAEIRSMDDSFALLTDYLKEKGLYDKTMIIFTSDHGEEFGEHGMWGMHSNTLFNEQLHVPLIIKLPENKYSGRRVHNMVRCIDILPTVMKLLKEDIPEAFEGVSLLPLMKGRRLKEDIVVISQLDAPETFVPMAWTIIYRKWKLYNLKLYNLITDPVELIDLARENKDLVKKLNRYTTDYLNRNMPGTTSSKKVKLDKDLKEKLKSLGYVK